MAGLPMVNANIKAKTITPVGDNIAIKLRPLQGEKKTAGGIYIPETSVSAQMEGIMVKGDVIGVSDKIKEEYKDSGQIIEVGDLVVFSKPAGLTINWNNKDEIVLLDIKKVIVKEKK